MRLEMIKGKEVSLFIEDAAHSINNKGFWLDSYTKAFEGLNDYIKYSDKIKSELSKIQDQL